MNAKTVYQPEIVMNMLSFHRRAVIEKICELFSLVPSLAINTPEYEVG